MRTYHDIVGDGGSNVVAQVEALERATRDALAGVRHRLAIGSGKGGVGKSTVTAAIARSLRRQGLEVAILDGDLNGPCQAQLLGLDAAPWIPGDGGLELPRSAEGIGVASIGSLLPGSRSMEFDSVAVGEEQTWRGTREFALLAQLLASIRWGKLDVLLFDLPPGAERTRQFADFLGPETAFVLITIPSDLARGVVARSIAALEKNESNVLGYVENMSGYFCRDCGEVKPLFPSSSVELHLPLLGTIPFDPALASGNADPSDNLESTHAVDKTVRRILNALEQP